MLTVGRQKASIYSRILLNNISEIITSSNKFKHFSKAHGTLKFLRNSKKVSPKDFFLDVVTKLDFKSLTPYLPTI